MKLSPVLLRRLHWINLPTVALIALLQRTPVVRVAIVVEDFVLSSRIGALLKSSLAASVSLGAVHTLAGATELSTSQNSPVTVAAGSSVSIGFAITGTLSEPESWLVGGSVPPGLTFNGGATSGTIAAAQLLLSGVPTTAGAYTMTLRATDQPTGQSTPTYNYTINVTGATATAPAITTHPQAQTVNAGANVTFTAAASGTPTPTFQWQKDGANIAGATSAALMLNNVAAGDAGMYRVVATNSAGSATSNGAALVVNAPSGAVPGTPASAGAYASGATEVTVTWRPPAGAVAATGYRLERATNDTFASGLVTVDLNTTATSHVDTTVAASTTYFYRLSALNAAGASAPTGVMQVQTPATLAGDTAVFVNISTRARCEIGDNVTIGGFVINGSTPKRVLIRAVGPSLTAHGIAASEVLVDPMITVNRGSTAIANNDDWTTNANAAEITSVSAQIGAAALQAGDGTSSALLMTLDPGVYTFVTSGKSGTSGIVLVEVYDADLAATSTFVNISTRAFCATGDRVTIGGFVINGSGPKRVLIRAVGPTLAVHGIAEPALLADPIIAVHRGSPLIATNDDWEQNANSAEIVTTGARIGASPLASTDSGSSALLLTLPPGVYTFIAHGKSETSGIVLVEVYDAD